MRQVLTVLKQTTEAVALISSKEVQQQQQIWAELRALSLAVQLLIVNDVACWRLPSVVQVMAFQLSVQLSKRQLTARSVFVEVALQSAGRGVDSLPGLLQMLVESKQSVLDLSVPAPNVCGPMESMMMTVGFVALRLEPMASLLFSPLELRSSEPVRVDYKFPRDNPDRQTKVPSLQRLEWLLHLVNRT